MAKRGRCTSDAEEVDLRSATRPAPADLHCGCGGSHSISRAACLDPSSVDCRAVNSDIPGPQPMVSEDLELCRHSFSVPASPEAHEPEPSPSVFEHPPAFYDNLSKLHLTKRALEEQSRRSYALLPPTDTSHPTQSANDYLDETQSLDDLRQYARHGGPDMLDIRGFPRPLPTAEQKQFESIDSSTVQLTKSTGPYDKNFLQKLIDGGIYPEFYEDSDVGEFDDPDNWAEIQHRITQPRESSSPTEFSEEAYQSFRKANARAARERAVPWSAVPTVEGDIQDAPGRCRGVVFSNLDPLTDGTLASAYPDIYYGANPTELSQHVRAELNGTIVPSCQADLPILPNFFLELKSHDGSNAVLERQVLYNGAVGARAMHSLRSYRQEQEPPISDNNAYTISCGYIGGTLTLYATRQVRVPGRKPQYATCMIGSWSMTGSIDGFIQGATCFRNARDWAREQRDEAIRLANARAEELSDGEETREHDSGDEAMMEGE